MDNGTPRIPDQRETSPHYDVSIPAVVAGHVPAPPVLTYFVGFVETLDANGDTHSFLLRTTDLDPDVMRQIAARGVEELAPRNDAGRTWRNP